MLSSPSKYLPLLKSLSQMEDCENDQRGNENSHLISPSTSSPALRTQWEIGQFDPAGLILIYAKHEEAFFGDAVFYRRTEFDR